MSETSLNLYNTLSRQKESFTPLEKGKVRLYACGPTVYNHQHIGNLRAYTFEDVLHRTLEALGYHVTHVMNITDVGHLQSDADAGDDKMMIAAAREQRSPWEIAREYEAEFFQHCALLNIIRPDIICRATEHIPEMIVMVQTLLAKGYAYQSGGNVYFDVAKFDRYTEFARLKMDANAQTDRVEHDERKRNQADFVLWFSVSKFPNQIMKWPSPWGEGFPGWHIECSAMASKYLGDRIDIHCGGIDHIPVHHTNEIAQSECCHGHQWVNYWMHNAFLNDQTGRMAKSKGDFLTLDVLMNRGYDPLDYRYLLLTAHYRGELNFSYEALDNARNTLTNLREKVLTWKAEATPQLTEATRPLVAAFWSAMADDLHTPSALAVLWGVVKDDTLTAAEKLGLIYDFDRALGLGLATYERKMASPELEAKAKAAIVARAAAKIAKNFAEADKIRADLLAEGIALEDGPDGTTWRYVGK